MLFVRGDLLEAGHQKLSTRSKLPEASYQKLAINSYLPWIICSVLSAARALAGSWRGQAADWLVGW